MVNVCQSHLIYLYISWEPIYIKLTHMNFSLGNLFTDIKIRSFFFQITLTFHSGLSKDLSLTLDDADVIIQVGDNQNTKEFYTHSVILQASSPYFKTAFSSNWIVKKNNMI